jgi:K+-transporting ATPase c subunit
MQKIIFKLLGVALVGSMAGAYYVWQEAIKVPPEYLEASANDRVDSQSLHLQANQITERAEISNKKITAPIERARSGQTVNVKLSDRDLNNLVVAKLANSHPSKQIPVGIQGIKTNTRDGKIYTGAMVNLDKLARNGKPGSQTAALSKITDRLTFLKGRDVYIGIVGRPQIEGSQIKFAPDAQIKIGNMNFTIDRLAKHLGVSPAQLQHTIDLQIQQQNFKVNRINIENNGLEIEGSKK